MKTSLDPLLEAIKIVDINRSINNSQPIISDIMKADYANYFSDEQERKMLEKLDLTLNQTLGASLQKALIDQGLTVEELSNDISLPAHLFRGMLTDSMTVTNIPILVFKRLINRLKISLTDVEHAVRNSTRAIKINLPASNLSYSVSYKRKDDQIAMSSENTKQAVLELFENDEAIELYLKRLKEVEDQ